MKSLADQYKKNGYLFNKIARIHDVAIYEQLDPETNRRVAFEVFEVQKNQERIIAGKTIEAGESVPGSEQWGIKAFTVWTMESAISKQHKLLNKAAERAAIPRP